MPELDPSALAGIRLQRSGVDVQMSRASIRARLFGGQPQPTRLGRFVVIERVGVGGMGVVYAAYDPELDRKVALKVLRNDVVLSRRSARQKQLLEEARAMARLSHANVVTVFEVGTVDDQVFVAMEFVDAPTLRGWLAAQERSPAEILDVFIQAGRGLAAAHAARLVHRDFKPENVMVPEAGPVQVTDFGLAVPVSPKATADVEDAVGRRLRGDATILTRELAGTPAYMAPEQLGRRPVDARADQYSFCLSLFEALAKHRPYDDDAILRMHAEHEFRPIIGALPERRGLSARATRAIERGLAFDPSDRFADMASLLRELSTRRRSRRSLLAVAAAGVVAAGIGGVVLGGERACQRRTERLRGVWDAGVKADGERAFARTELSFAPDAWIRVESSLDEYAGAWLEMHTQACLATQRGEQSDQMLDRRMRCLDLRLIELAAVADVLRSADADVVENAVRVAGGVSAVSDCVAPEDRQLAGFASPSPEVEQAEAAAKAAEALRRAGKFDEALRRADEAVAAAETSAYNPAIVTTELVRGRIRLAMARGEPAQESFERVLALGGETGQLEDVAAAAIGVVETTGVADAEHANGLVLARAAAIAVASAGNPPRLRARLELSRARVLYGAGELDRGLEHASQGLDILEAGGSQAELADALQVQGTLLYGKGRLTEASEFSERALTLRKAVFGAAHPSVAESLSNLAAIALARRDVVAALQLFEQALQLRRESLGAGHPDTAKTLTNLASAMRVKGDLVGARDGYVQALQQLEASVGEDDPRVAAVLLNLGAVQYELADVEPAVAAYERALAMQRRTLGPGHPQLSVTLANLGRARLEREEAQEAAALFEEALAIRTQMLGPDHPRTVAAKIAVASARVELRQFAAARELLTSMSGADDAQEAERVLWLGRVALDDGKNTEAIGWLRTALALREKIDAAPGELAAAQLLLAHAHAGAGKQKQAAALAARCSEVISGPRPPQELREFCASDCRAEIETLSGSREND